MKLSPMARDLYHGISELEIVDAHEHLPPEADYLAADYGGLNMFAGYVWHDLESAGLDPEFKATMRDGGARPVDEWWPVIRPYWNAVRHTSFARALRITARGVFGLDDISDATIHEFAERVRADNTPGLYRRILLDRCNIRRVVSCGYGPEYPEPFMVGLTALEKAAVFGPDARERLGAESDTEILTLDDLVEASAKLLERDIAAGAVGFKTVVADHAPPDRNAAEAEFAEAVAAETDSARWSALRDYCFDRALDIAAEADLPVAVHTGFWGDFRNLDPKFLLGFAARRRDVRFDMFHLGMPMMRDAAMIGKTMPNVTLDLCWCAIISQTQTKRMIDELVDLVPADKIIAFGGDYRVCVQKVYGHLVMAREAVAAALADRIDAGDLDSGDAHRLARLWFHDNPARIYGLPEAKDALRG